MEDVLLSVPPVREAFVVAGLPKYRFSFVDILFKLLLLHFSFEALESILCRRRRGHLVWIDNFGLLLKIKSFAIFQHDRVLVPVLEVALIAGAKSLRVWVPDKTVGYSRLPGAFVAYRHGVTQQSFFHVLFRWRSIFPGFLANRFKNFHTYLNFVAVADYLSGLALTLSLEAYDLLCFPYPAAF